MTDLHCGLNTEVLDTLDAGGLQMQLVKLCLGKDSTEVGLHVNPRSFGTAGLQATDMLAFLGFESGPCPFIGGSCFSKRAPENLSLARFSTSFVRYSELMKAAAQALQSCGYIFPQPEGWGHFTGRPSRRRARRPQATGDGHRAAKHERMKESEDNQFEYVFSWIDGSSDKGWVTHYRPKDAAALEMLSRFRRIFAEVQRFEECPEFDFEECHWRFEAFQQTQDFFRSNADAAHRHFDAHAKSFGEAVVSLLAADAVASELQMVPLGPASTIDSRRARPLVRSNMRRQKPTGDRDVFLCHASEDKGSVLTPLREALDSAGISYWFDEAEVEWGDSVTEQVNRGLVLSRFVIVVLSEHFVGKPWPEREFNAALNLESTTGDVKVLPLIVGDDESVKEVIGAYPLLNDKLYLRWKDSGESVVRALRNRLGTEGQN